MSEDANERKNTPVFSGVLNYFPDAIAEVARTSFIGNEQHNPGTPLHWDRSKSGDELDALARHLLSAGTTDSDGIRHSAKVAWRALANLQKEIERERMEAYKEQIIEESKVIDCNCQHWCGQDYCHPREFKEEEKRKLRIKEAEVTIDSGFSTDFKRRWSEDRMNVIGQNGNDGLHYDDYPISSYPEPDGVEVAVANEQPDGWDNTKK